MLSPEHKRRMAAFIVEGGLCSGDRLPGPRTSALDLPVSEAAARRQRERDWCSGRHELSRKYAALLDVSQRLLGGNDLEARRPGRGIILPALRVVPVKVRVHDKFTGLSLIVLICSITARAAEGLECVSTTRTESSSTTISALQLILYICVVMAA